MADYDLLPDDDRDLILSDALTRRYGTTNVKKITQMLDQELGLKPYKTRVSVTPELKPKLNAWGAYQNNPGRIAIQAGANDANRVSTLAHELGHVADEVFDTPAVNQGPMQTRLHHSNFRNFEPEFADNLTEQSAIEMGLPPRQDLLTKMPWLRQVKRQSSNKLASPWSGAKPSIPADIYNGTRNNDPIDVMIRGLQNLTDRDEN